MTKFRVNKTKYIDQTKTVSFNFDGKSYHGFEGDTLASALLSNGVHLVGRSFKYHRPRGIVSSGCEEPNAICQINEDTDLTEPNVRATEIELYELHLRMKIHFGLFHHNMDNLLKTLVCYSGCTMFIN